MVRSYGSSSIPPLCGGQSSNACSVHITSKAWRENRCQRSVSSTSLHSDFTPGCCMGGRAMEGQCSEREIQRELVVHSRAMVLCLSVSYEPHSVTTSYIFIFTTSVDHKFLAHINFNTPQIIVGHRISHF